MSVLREEACEISLFMGAWGCAMVGTMGGSIRVFGCVRGLVG